MQWHGNPSTNSRKHRGHLRQNANSLQGMSTPTAGTITSKIFPNMVHLKPAGLYFPPSAERVYAIQPGRQTPVLVGWSPAHFGPKAHFNTPDHTTCTVYCIALKLNHLGCNRERTKLHRTGVWHLCLTYTFYAAYQSKFSKDTVKSERYL